MNGIRLSYGVERSVYSAKCTFSERSRETAKTSRGVLYRFPRSLVKRVMREGRFETQFDLRIDIGKTQRTRKYIERGKIKIYGNKTI